jgi:hypothetical protein
MSESECRFSNVQVTISGSQTRISRNAHCPICGAIRKVNLRSYGFAFPAHKPLDGDPVKRECWVRGEDGQWRLKSETPV